MGQQARGGTAPEMLREPPAPEEAGSGAPSAAEGAPRLFDPILLGIVAVAAVLRLVGIGAQSLWYDEMVTTFVVNAPLTDLLAEVGNLEGAPPLYYAFGWAWIRVVGEGDAALRSLSALFGVALVPVVAALCRELGLRRRVWRVAAVLTAVHPMLVWYSQEARVYSLFALLGGLAVLLFVRCLRRGSMTDLVLWSLVSAAAVGTHYFAVFLVAPMALWLVVVRPQPLPRLVLAGIPLAVVTALAGSLGLAQRAQGRQEWVADFPVPFRLAEAGRHALTGPAGPDDRLWYAGLAVVVVAGAVAVTEPDRRGRRAAGLMAFLAAAVVVLPLVVLPDAFLGRNVIVALVPLLVVVAVGLGSPRARQAGMAGTAVLVVLSVGMVAAVATQPELQKPDWRAVAEVLGSSADDRVVVMDGNGYLGLPLFRYLDDARNLKDAEMATTEIDLLVHGVENRRCGRWVGLACEVLLLPSLPPALAERFTEVERVEFDGFQIVRYRSDEPVVVSRETLVAPSRVPLTMVMAVEGSAR